MATAQGGGAKPRPAAFTVVAADVSSANTFFREDARGALQAQVCLIQELAVGPLAQRAVLASSRELGWPAVVAPPVPTAAGGWSA